MSEFKAVIFDLDGVIVSTDIFHYQAWKKIADQENIYFDEKINSRLRGVSRMESLDIILENGSKAYSNEEKSMLAKKKNSYYVKLLSSMNKAYVLPYVFKVIETLKEKSIKIAIGSSSKNARIILEKIGLINSFNAIVDGNDITNSKPSPEVFLKAADLLDASPNECIVVEDAEAGIKAAIGAQMYAFAFGEKIPLGLANQYSNSLLQLLNLID